MIVGPVVSEKKNVKSKLKIVCAEKCSVKMYFSEYFVILWEYVGLAWHFKPFGVHKGDQWGVTDAENQRRLWMVQEHLYSYIVDLTWRVMVNKRNKIHHGMN